MRPTNLKPGMKIYELTILDFDEEKMDFRLKNNKQRKIFYKCKCSCGTICSIDKYRLEKGKVKSCGCLTKHKSPNNFKSLVGEKFGNLLVMSIDREKMNEYNKDSRCFRTFYKCKCDCGNKTTVEASHLKSKKTISCGCIRKQALAIKKPINLVGDTYGRLIVLNLDKNRSSKYRKYWICRCQCGNIKSISAGKLRSGSTVSCGCYAKYLASISGTKLGKNFDKYNKYKWYFIKNTKKVYCKSSYEVLYANYLIINEINFEYEPKTFVLKENVRYTPDFYLPKSNTYIEIKGTDLINNQKDKREMFSKIENLKTFFYEDLYEICDLKYKHSYEYIRKAKTLNLLPEDYLGLLIYYN